MVFLGVCKRMDDRCGMKMNNIGEERVMRKMRERTVLRSEVFRQLFAFKTLRLYLYMIQVQNTGSMYHGSTS